MTLVQSAVGSLRDVNPCLVQLFPVTCPPDLENHETKSCCTLIPCCLCFWLTDYDGNVTYGEACWSDIHNSYRGTLDGDADLKLFEFRWERDTAAPGDPCQHVVNFDVDEVYRENSCDCETPEGIASTIYGDIQWQRQVKQKRIIWDPPGTCETHCPQCTCVADKVCITWEKHAGTGSCSEPCLQSILEAEWNCDTEQFEVIFEPDCCGDEDPVTIYIRLDEASGADCAWVLEVDGVIEDTINALEGQDCGDPELDFEYIHDDGCTVTISTAGRQCGCAEADRQTCCCPDEDTPEKLYVTIHNQNECPCVDGRVFELDLISYCAPTVGTGIGATWQGEDIFCPLDEYSDPTDNECTIRITVECQPSPTCAWQLNWCTGGDDCGDLETECSNPRATVVGSCDGQTGPTCNPLLLTFTGGDDDCCCNPDNPATQFCFSVTEIAP